MQEWLGVEAESVIQFSPAPRGHAERTRVQVLGYPSSLDRYIEDRSSERAAKVRASFTPIHAGTREASAERAGRI